MHDKADSQKSSQDSDYHRPGIFGYMGEKLHFYRATLCIHGTSHGPVSVCHKSVFY